MGDQNRSTRRQFLKTCARGAGVVAVGSVAAGLTRRADADKVWQLNPDTCTTCSSFRNEEGWQNGDGWGRCATTCVRQQSAVRAVNDFSECGYCFICPAYYDVTSERYTEEEALEAGDIDLWDTYKTLICKQDAIIRKVVGEYYEDDPSNNLYEYTIDETKCNGCGLCVENCKPPMGNGSLRLEVRHDLCLDCNKCAIARDCPVEAFSRTSVRSGKHPGYPPPSVSGEQGTHS